MIKTAAILMLPVGLAAPADLATSYKANVALQVEAETTFEMETTSFEMLIDGEPADRPSGGEGGATTEWRHSVEVATILELTDGAPTKVRREWREVEAGEEEGSDDHPDAPLEGVVAEITRDADGEYEVDVVEGSEPEDELLEALRTMLRLDVLLPTGDATDWELDGDAVRHALGLDVEAGLFPAPRRERPEGRRRDFVHDLTQERRRGGGMRGGGDSGARLFGDAEWEGRAKLAELTEDYEGQECAVIELEFEASGELPERGGFGGFGGGRGGRRGDRSVRPEPAPAAAFENTFEIKLEGRLLFSKELNRPVLLELEGTTRSERHMQRGRGEREIEINVTREGTYAHTVKVSEVESE